MNPLKFIAKFVASHSQDIAAQIRTAILAEIWEEDAKVALSRLATLRPDKASRYQDLILKLEDIA